MNTYSVSITLRTEYEENYREVIVAKDENEAREKLRRKHHEGNIEPQAANWSGDIENIDNMEPSDYQVVLLK